MKWSDFSFPQQMILLCLGLLFTSLIASLFINDITFANEVFKWVILAIVLSAIADAAKIFDKRDKEQENKLRDKEL